VKLVDSHCHLDDEQFAADREEVIGRALEAGVASMMAIGTGSGPPDLEAGVRLAEAHDFIYASVGVHPHDAAKATPADFDRLRALLGHPKVLGMARSGWTTTTTFRLRSCSAACSRGSCGWRLTQGSPLSSTPAKHGRTPCGTCARLASGKA
jgi:hypothetical protein